jgi:heat shock protein HslJ
VAILLLAGCSLPAESRLGSTRWKLVSLSGAPLQARTAITLFFEPGGFTGSAGCNIYGGNYSTTLLGSFKVGEVALTAMACFDPPGVMEQEQAYIQALAQAKSYVHQGTELVLVDGQGRALLHYRQQPSFAVQPEDLIGKTWRLVSAGGMTGADLSAFTIQFNRAGLGGTTTCRSYAGQYQADGDTLHVLRLEMTSDEARCSTDQLKMESAYTTLIEAIEQFNLDGDLLQLYTRRGEELVFELEPR